MKSEQLNIGDRVRLSGGYSYEPVWLAGKDDCYGTVVDSIPGQNRQPAMVVELEQSISAEGIIGKFLVLELRFVGATWAATGTVHVELCDFRPEKKRWQDRRQGKWVESHATYERSNEYSQI